MQSMDYLQDLLSRGEGKTLEFKRDLSSPDGFLKTVIAFANTSGGKVVIGVEDKTKTIRGVKDPLLLEEQILFTRPVHQRFADGPARVGVGAGRIERELH